MIVTYTNSTYPDEKFIIEWVANYPKYLTLNFPDVSMENDNNNRSWKISKINTTLSNRNPLNLIYAGDGHLWYKKDENRLFINSYKIMNDPIKNNYSMTPNNTSCEDLQFI